MDNKTEVALWRFQYRVGIVAQPRMNIALRPIRFRSSCSGSDAHARNVVTSLAICARPSRQRA